MGIFGNKSLLKRGILKDATEWHCHILPGVDDGVKTMKKSLEALAYYEEAGVKDIWLTPHIMEDVPNTIARLREVFDDLRDAYKGDIQLHLAAENMLDSLYEERLASGDVLPIGDGGNHMLVETSYFSPPANFEQLLETTMKKGYYPVLAHPERYIYMDRKWYMRLLDMGVKLQLNIFSLQGAYGDEAREKAKWLHKKGLYAIAGTDTHNPDQLMHFLYGGFPEKRLTLGGL